MNLISRRQALRSSGFVLGAPLMGSIFYSDSLAQTSSVPSSVPPQPLVPLNQDLLAWTNAQICNVYSKVSNKSATREDLRLASSQMHMYAHHITKTGADAVIKYQAKTGPDMSNSDFSADPSIEQKYRILSQYNPHITRDKVVKYHTSTPAENSETQALLGTKGMAGIYHDSADIIHKFAGQLPPSVSLAKHSDRFYLTPERHTSSLVSAVYYPSRKPHLMNVSFGSVCKKVVCASLTNKWAKHAVSALISGAIEYGAGVAADGVCAADAASAIILDISSAGGASIATPLEVALCVGAQGAAAGLMKFAAGVGIDTVVDDMMDQLKELLDC